MLGLVAGGMFGLLAWMATVPPFDAWWSVVGCAIAGALLVRWRR